MSGESREILIVGSVPLAGAEEVFKTVGSALGDRVRAVPDGETGPRLQWVNWQSRTFEQHPGFERSSQDTGDWRTDSESWKSKGWFALCPGTDVAALSFDDLGYAKTAIESYRTFQRCKKDGFLSSSCRFQVAIPTPYNVIDQLIVPAQRIEVERAFERRMLQEIGQISSVVPHEELAIQWDVAHEVQNLAGGRPHWFEDAERQIIDRLTRLAEAIPTGAKLGFHLCYGDFAHKHFIEPTDTGLMVRLSNALSRSVSRTIDWIHMPVPRGRTDHPYFAPLAELHLDPGTRVFLGLIHYSDGVDGARSRIAAAADVLDDFGVATECGFGRRSADTVLPLLRLHAEVADLALTTSR